MGTRHHIDVATLYPIMQYVNRQTKNASLLWVASILFGLLCSLIALPAWADVDLIDEGKTDGAIKMLVFPKSLRVIENRAAQVGKLEATLSDPKLIRKTLLKIDPSRVVPAKAGEPFAGPVTRDRLRELAKRYDEDVIFVFRGELNIEPESLTEKELLSTEHVVYIRYRGLLYLARQKRLLVLKGNEKMDQFAGSVSPEQREERWRNLSVDGLKTLAQEARKLLHSHKFEKRQSAY